MPLLKRTSTASEGARRHERRFASSGQPVFPTSKWQPLDDEPRNGAEDSKFFKHRIN